MTTVIPTDIPSRRIYRLLLEFYSRKRKRKVSSSTEPSIIVVKIGSYFIGRSFRPVGFAKILIDPTEKGSNLRVLFDFKIYYIMTLAFECFATVLLLTLFLSDYLKGQSFYELALVAIVILVMFLFPYFNLSMVKETKTKFIAEARKFIKRKTVSEV